MKGDDDLNTKMSKYTSLSSSWTDIQTYPLVLYLHLNISETLNLCGRPSEPQIWRLYDTGGYMWRWLSGLIHWGGRVPWVTQDLWKDGFFEDKNSKTVNPHWVSWLAFDAPVGRVRGNEWEGKEKRVTLGLPSLGHIVVESRWSRLSVSGHEPSVYPNVFGRIDYTI